MRKGLSLLAAGLVALPLARPVTLVLPVGLTAAFVAGQAEAQRRSSGGYSRPSYSGSRTPSTSSRPSAPRAPSVGGSGGYSRPSSGSPSVIPGFGGSASDRGYARQGSGDALQRYRERETPRTPSTTAPAGPLPGPSAGGPLGWPTGRAQSGGGWNTNGGWGSGWQPAPYRDDYFRRGGGFGFPGGGVPGSVIAGPRGFGVWDAAFLWFLFSNLNRPGSTDFFHNHRSDPAIQDWRRQVEQQAQSDPEVRRRLDDLDAALQQRRNDPVDPTYLPPDAPPTSRP
ncbi:hypothetical protein ACE7GA_13010 [Roseomonas sp. CCTCC AB2023176]|uniref:hypothetical protein n=1 Tax=Roseomonas sp. CCTCC AB2023176 TaxID=3342640 RepID=UPI0035DD80BB